MDAVSFRIPRAVVLFMRCWRETAWGLEAVVSDWGCPPFTCSRFPPAADEPQPGGGVLEQVKVTELLYFLDG